MRSLLIMAAVAAAVIVAAIFLLEPSSDLSQQEVEVLVKTLWDGRP